jgi:hypothetical protein
MGLFRTTPGIVSGARIRRVERAVAAAIIGALSISGTAQAQEVRVVPIAGPSHQVPDGFYAIPTRHVLTYLNPLNVTGLSRKVLEFGLWGEREFDFTLLPQEQYSVFPVCGTRLVVTVRKRAEATSRTVHLPCP